MGLIKKKTCDCCGKEISFFSGQKIQDGVLCPDCKKRFESILQEHNASFECVSLEEIIEFEKEHFEKLHQKKANNKFTGFLLMGLAFLLIIIIGASSSISSSTTNNDSTTVSRRDLRHHTESADSNAVSEPIQIRQPVKTPETTIEINIEKTASEVKSRVEPAVCDVKKIKGYTDVESFFMFIKPNHSRAYLEEQAKLFGLKHTFVYGGDNGGGDPTSGIIELYIGTNDADIRFENYPSCEYIKVTIMHDDIYNYKLYLKDRFNSWVEATSDGYIGTRHDGILTFNNPDYKWKNISDAIDYELSCEDD